MKQMGFTLVELLGVIIILGAIIAIVTVSVGSVIDKSQRELTEIQISRIEEAAKNYYIHEGMDDSDYTGEQLSKCVTVNYLMENGYIDETELPNLETEENNYGGVRIYYDGKKYKYIYSKTGCQICTLVDDTGDEGISPGDKYQCKVKDNMEEEFKDGYFFYVLSQNTDGTTNLIMNRNLPSVDETDSAVYWINYEDYKAAGERYNDAWGDNYWNYCDGDYIYGPITALKELKKRTADWINIDKYNYELDYVQGIYKGEYVQDIRARLPKLADFESLELTNWLKEGLWDSGDENFYGYWLSDAFAAAGGCAEGFVYGIAYDVGLSTQTITTPDMGVRPVITVMLGENNE